MSHEPRPPGGEPTTRASGGGSRFGVDLAPRVISGLVLAALAVFFTWAGGEAFKLLVLVVALVVAWEWGRVVRSSEVDLALFVHAAAVIAAFVIAWQQVSYGWGLLAILLGCAATFYVAREASPALSAIGVLYTGIPALATIWFRTDPALGFAAVILLYICVWGTDTAAYFSGRLIGGPKLWPRVSPNKTWAGLIGGVSASMLAAVICASFVPGASVWRLAMIGLSLGLISQAGDLAESALKRGHGVKDASALIPGHGGFLDRVDGFVFAVCAAALLAFLVDKAHPARALLIGL